MNMNAGTDTPDPNDPLVDDGAAQQHSLTWVDVDRRSWRIELAPQRVVLRDGDDVVDLQIARWRNDVHVARHGDGFIIRIETFERALCFVVSDRAADPFLTHIGASTKAPDTAADVEEPPVRRAPLLWPKVSPLAVWALISSSLVFIPVLGLLPAIITVVLLLLHRRSIRRAQAWRHSRALCVGALVFLITGLLVSALSTWGLLYAGAAGTAESSLALPAQGGRNWGLIAGAIIVVLFSLTVHEAAHAITAWWLGDALAKSQGRVTLNPLAHIDPFGTVLLPLILAMAGLPVFGYARPVPVRVESLPRHRRAHILISIAGPGSNMLLAAASLMLLIGLGCLVRWAVPSATFIGLGSPDFTAPIEASGFMAGPALAAFCTILKLGFVINTFLAMFNLIPIPPLDGSWVLEHLFPNSLGRLYERIRPYGFLIFLGAIYGGLFQYLIWPALLILVPGFRLLGSATGS